MATKNTSIYRISDGVEFASNTDAKTYSMVVDGAKSKREYPKHCFDSDSFTRDKSKCKIENFSSRGEGCGDDEGC